MEASDERFARFRASLTPPADAERPQTFTAAQLRERLGMSGTEAEQLLGHAQRLGVLVNLGEQRYEVPSPSVLALAEQAVASGISLAGAVDVFER